MNKHLFQLYNDKMKKLKNISVYVIASHMELLS